MYEQYPFDYDNKNRSDMPMSADDFDAILHYSDELLESQSQFFNRRKIMNNQNRNDNKKDQNRNDNKKDNNKRD